VNFLITSVGTATSVGIIKNIRKYAPEARIIGTDINPEGYTAGSLLVDAFYRVPLGKEPAYEASIRGIITGETIDVFWPVNDTEIRKVSEWDLEESCRCIVAAPELIDILQDKKTASEQVAAMGLTVPEEAGPGCAEPVILRERVGVGSTGIRFLPDLLSEPVPDGVFAQRRIGGTEYTVDTLCNCKGEPLYIIPRSRLEIKAGIATKTRIEDRELLIRSVQTLLKQWKLPGFSNTQWIVDEKGTAYFIETNPRIGGFTSASMLAAPGMFPAYLELLSGNEPVRELNRDVHWNMIVTRYYEEICFEET